MKFISCDINYYKNVVKPAQLSVTSQELIILTKYIEWFHFHIFKNHTSLQYCGWIRLSKMEINSFLRKYVKIYVIHCT